MPHLAPLKVGDRRPPYCSPEQFQAIVAQASELLWQALIAVIYSTGIRRREAINLTWADIDVKAGELHVTGKVADGYVQEWTPKDHEVRTLPLPEQALNLLTALQAVAPEHCPYVFMDAGRWAYYRECVDTGRWQSRDLVNNTLRRFKTLCRRACEREFTIHDLRRSCITNWARENPIHVVQYFAGHADINTTEKYYLSIQREDVAKAKKTQEALLGKLIPSTDPKLTHKGRKRSFEGRKQFRSPPEIAA